jgi:Putative zinc-finger
MRCMQTVEAGAYVLGALSPAERTDYQRHLGACAGCRDEVADLAGLPGLLGRLDEPTASGLTAPAGAPAATSVAAPPALLSDVLDRASGERHRARRRGRLQVAGIAVAAAVAAVVAGLGISTVHGAGRIPADAALATMDVVQPGEPVIAVIGYRPAREGGTDIYMNCTYADMDRGSDEWRLQLMVVPRRGGGSWPVHGWEAYPGQSVSFRTHTNLAPGDIDRIEVQMASGTRLLSYRLN